jgi:hypothetical protein
MNVGRFISGLKQKARDRESNKVVRVARELESLKSERVRVEGQKKIYSLKAKELSRIKGAKAELKQLKRENSVLGRIGMKVQEHLKEVKNTKKDKHMVGFSNDSPNAWFPKK